MSYKVPGGIVAATYVYRDGDIVVEDYNQDPRIGPALAEFQRQTIAAFTPEGRFTADKAFVQVVTRLLAGEALENTKPSIGPDNPCENCGGTTPMSETDGRCERCAGQFFKSNTTRKPRGLRPQNAEEIRDSFGSL